METVHGVNALGQLLTQLRADFISNKDAARTILAPEFTEPFVLGIPTGKIVPLSGEPLLHREVLTKLGLPPGPAFGVILHACFQCQLTGEFSTLEKALQIAKALWNAHTQIEHSE